DPADRTPIDLLRDAGVRALAEQLQGTVRGAVETRDGIYETARQCVSCLLDPEILAWVTPDPDLPQFRPHDHVLAKDTLYLLSKDGGGSAAGVIAGIADATMRAGVVAAERRGGRLDPPMTAVLDEAANVCRISDLPDLYSHLGSRGINVVTLLLATGVRPALIRLRPWYKEPNAGAIGAAAAKETQAITDRAAQKWETNVAGQ